MNKRLPQLIWVIVAIVLLVGLWRAVMVRTYRSADQKILIEKAK